MAISKKERSLSIWIGIAIGVAVSSMLVRYALQKKEEQTKERPGNYKSLKCASDGSPFLPIPEGIREKIPHGIVVYFENNQSIQDGNLTTYQRSWTIESAGSFRSERLFIWAKENSLNPDFNEIKDYRFHRASELYILPKSKDKKDEFENLIDEDHYKIIGENSKTGEWIIQIKDFSPTGIRNAIRTLKEFRAFVSSVRIIPWAPNR
jgi:hypothetical protein